MNETIDEISELDLREKEIQNLKEMAAQNIGKWVEELSEGAWKGLRHDEKEDRYVATFDFDEFDEDDDSDATLSGTIVATVRQFQLTPNDLEGLTSRGENL